MKKIGRFVMMGQISGNTNKKFHLWDGTFKSGYRIVEFITQDSEPTTSTEHMGVLGTKQRSVSASTDWSDVTQLAWTQYQAPSANTHSETVIRDDNMVIEDLYLDVYATADNRVVNYKIVLEKYEFTDWTGAGILVENNAQAGPQ